MANFPGTAGNDTYAGTGADDTILDGGGGNDSLFGAGGNDTVTVTGGLDTVGGDAGTDTLIVDYSASTFTVVSNHTQSVPIATRLTSGSERVDFTGFERFMITVGSGGSTISLGVDADQTLNGGSGPDSFTTLAGADVLNGAGGADFLRAGDGDDLISGGEADDYILVGGTSGGGDDTVDGGAGADRLDVDYSDATGAIVATEVTTGVGGVSGTFSDGSGLRTVQVSGVENLHFEGGAFDDQLTGLVLEGNAGNDTLTGFGRVFDISLLGGEGDDTLVYLNNSTSGYKDGGAGFDTFDWSASALGVDMYNGGSFSIQLASIEAVILTEADDIYAYTQSQTVSTLGGNDTLYVNDVDYTLDGGLGIDTLIGRGTALSIDLAITGAQDVGAANLTLSNIENLTSASNVVANFKGDGADNVFIGGSLADTLDGRNGADTLTGKSGADSLVGGGGNDLLIGDFAIDNLGGGGSSGVDSLDGGAGDDVLDTGQGLSSGESYNGGSGADTLRVHFGDFRNVTLTSVERLELFSLSGNSNTITFGASQLGAGLATIVGDDRSSFDSLSVYLAAAGTLDASGIVFENWDAGVDYINLYGTSGNDRIIGTGEDDTLRGGLGADTLDGGAGSDTAIFLDRTAAVELTLNGAATATVTVGGVAQGSVVRIENVIGGSGNDRLTGDGLANDLSGANGDDTLAGAGGADDLFGGAGNDKLYGGDGDDTLGGSSGDDLLEGGAGFDIANYNGAGALVIDLSLTGAQNTLGGGIDTLVDIEGVVGYFGADRLTGNGAANRLIGNFGADTLTGSGGGDTLDGGIGNDQISGGKGVDVITGAKGADALLGGAGLDRFVYLSVDDSRDAAGFGIDRVKDFAAGDKIDLSAIDAIAGGADDPFDFVGKFHGAAGEATIKYNATKDVTTIRADLDGDKAADFELTVVGPVVETDFIA